MIRARSHLSPAARLDPGVAAYVTDRLQSEHGRRELRVRLRALAEHTLVDQLIERRDVAAIVARLRWPGFMPRRGRTD